MSGKESEQEREKRVFRYMARYGQHPETEARYRDAVQACQNIENLSLTITEIARSYDLAPECLRNQLKRHFPNVIPQREKLRESLGFSSKGNRGLKASTVAKYAEAVEILRNSTLTVREVASQCGVSYQGLQQHLLFYHKDIAESRMLARTDALLRPVKKGELAATGGVRVPRPEAEKLYAPAVELYSTTTLSVPEIAKRFGLAPHNLESYLRKWHKDEVEKRQRAREKALKEKKDKGRKPSRFEVVEMKYAPAVERLRAGESFSEAALALGLSGDNLRWWVKRHDPDLAEAVIRANMVLLPEGTYCQRESWQLFKDAV